MHYSGPQQTKIWQVLLGGPNGTVVGTKTFTLNAGFHYWTFPINAYTSALCLRTTHANPVLAESCFEPTFLA